MEILAPCGSSQAFFTAINNYADAVYLGVTDFSARKNADNFTLDNVAFYIAYAHTFNVKVYVCVNTIIKSNELQSFFNTVKACYLAGADAFIVQDMFLGKQLKLRFKNIVLHLSTQSGVNNLQGALLAKEFGFSRVVLARETQFAEIKQIASVIETEVFVQGALCSCFSGHCYMSSFIGGNSGNRGLCRQPCRKKYKYSFAKDQCYALSLADLCLADKVNELKNAGVCSLKIEGRMRSPEYVASAINLYKKALSGQPTDKAKDLVKRTFNRGNFTSGYVFGTCKNLLSTSVQGNLGLEVQTIEKFAGDKIYLKQKAFKDSGYKIIRNGKEVGNAKCLADGYQIVFSGQIKVGDKLFITKDTSLAFSLAKNRLKPLEITADFSVGNKAELSCNGVSVCSENVLERAKSQPLTYNDLLSSLEKVDVYPFEVVKLTAKIDNVFIVKKELNALRKSLYEKVFYKQNSLECHNVDLVNNFVFDTKKSIAVISCCYLSNSNGKIEHFIYAPTEYSLENAQSFLQQAQSETYLKYLYIPAFLTSEEIEKIAPIISLFDGVYAEGLFAISLAKKLGKKVFGGIELNVTNHIDASQLQSLGIQNFAVSKELSFNDITDFSGYVLTLGSLKVMSLVYCPNNRNCADCAVCDNETLTDTEGRVFPVRRYKSSACRFEIFNDKIICAKKPSDKMIFDFTSLSFEQSQNLLHDYFEFGLAGVAKKYSCTNGNLVKGIN